MRREAAWRLVSAIALLGTFVSASQPAPSTEAYTETIPGTVVSFDMVPVPGGAVIAGGKETTIAPFYIGRTEATWDMYDAFVLDTPREGATADATARPSQPYGAPDYGWGHAGFPVISVTRAAADAFCSWLSARTGKKYRLPTEAEWAHVARLAAGGETLSPRRRSEIASYRRDSSAPARTRPVGARHGDALGLRDLFGNAAEWVATTDGALVLRGGSFRDVEENVGPSARAVQDDSWNERDPQLPKSRWWLSDAPFAGFRIVAEIGNQEPGTGTGGAPAPGPWPPF
jgi:formylglycine-generating enzyme required for sulfatase activity